MMERAVIIGNGRSMEVGKALGIMPQGSTAPPAPSAVAATVAPPPAPPAGSGATAASAQDGAGVARLDEAMAEHIRTALKRCHGRIEGPFGAGAHLGINPHTLRARMRKLKIDWTAYRHARTGAT